MMAIGEEALGKLSKEEFLDLTDHTGDIKQAEIHLKSNRIFDYDKIDMKNNIVDLCDDCMCPVPKEGVDAKYEFCVSTKKLSNYGIGLYLYFFYMKYMALILVVLFGMVAVPQMYFAGVYNDDLSDHCLVNPVNKTVVATSTNSTVSDLDWNLP
eukprot:CAMPEP_0170526062 /NCGR_PEP_ID=MMETSP0209-20121228/11532_1 /TAXON_ID=665100 ORGANISM="Litonotus pictus, Strain P1" /NCGR_SAMPLE_ID=MMETSP0209 /ASSEMBLY_ACC=CAM_ASM_000301 /LENGTH=153 /DNA_ID=CAMNT_0010815697 /DNA_START=54 /DNA_END=511 /DNA_ORIENTATION=+